MNAQQAPTPTPDAIARLKAGAELWAHIVENHADERATASNVASIATAVKADEPLPWAAAQSLEIESLGMKTRTLIRYTARIISHEGG